MKKTRIEITNQLEKTVHVFYVNEPNYLTNNEVLRIKNKMNVEMVFVKSKLYK